MPKKKSGFIDKSKAVKFLLDFRDPEDPNYRNKAATERVLKPYELLRSKKEKYDLKARNKLIRKLAEEPYQFEERVEWDESDGEKEERETRDKKRAERKAAAAGGPKKPVVTADIMDQIKGRKDLWFNELHKNDPMAEPSKKPIDVEIQPVPKGVKKEKHVSFKEPLDNASPKKKRDDKKKKVEEVEEDEWEDEEEEEVEEIEMDEEEWEDAEGDWEDEGEEEEVMKKDTKKKPKKEFKMTEKDVDIDHEAIEKFQPAEGVQMKRYDENGLPIDGYDYYQHIAGDEGPEPIAVFTADYKMPVKLAIDMDMKPEDMNPDEKEVFQAMEDEDCLEEAGYDMLDDDFIKQANEGEAALVEADPKNKSKKGAKGAAKDSGATGSGGNSLGLFMNNPNVKVNIKEKGALDARNIDYVMKEFDDADRPQQNGPGMSNDAFDNILNEHMQGIRNRAHFEDFIIKEQKKKQKEMEAQMESEKPDKLENYFDQLKPEDDKAMKRYLENPSDEEPDEEEMVRRYMATHDDDCTTNISLKSVNSSRVQKQLNIIKEDRTKPAKKAEEKKPVVQEESDEEEEEGEDLGQKLKRNKKETKEERKARKDAVKEAKKERKEKKQNFKDQFKNARVKSLHSAAHQVANMEGLAVYKL